MQCFVYRSSIKDGLYVYLADEDGLGHEDITAVRKNLEDQGFHIQMPKDIEHLVKQAADDSQQDPL